MKSPTTGKRMKLQVEKADFQFKGEHFIIQHLFYLDEDTGAHYTDENLDAVTLHQVYELYAEKHGLTINEVKPGPVLDFKEQQPIMVECSTCKLVQPYTFPMSGKLFCTKCGELIDEIVIDDI